MKLELEKWTFDKSISYKIVNINTCCEEITHTNIIDFRSGWFENCKEYNEDIGIVLHEENAYMDEDEYLNTNDRYYKISKCPFCGADIHIEIVSEVDKTEDYLQIQAEVYALRKKISNCDSKKRSYDLEKEFRELNNELEEFHHNDSIKTIDNYEE